MNGFKDKIKRVVSILAALCVMVLSFPVVSFASYSEEDLYAYDVSRYADVKSEVLQHFRNNYLDDIICDYSSLMERFLSVVNNASSHNYFVVFYMRDYDNFFYFSSDVPFSISLVSYSTDTYNSSQYYAMFDGYSSKPSYYMNYQNDHGGGYVNMYDFKGYIKNVGGGKLSDTHSFSMVYVSDNVPVYDLSQYQRLKYNKYSVYADDNTFFNYGDNVDIVDDAAKLFTDVDDKLLEFWGEYTNCNIRFSSFADSDTSYNNSQYDSTLAMSSFNLTGVYNPDYATNYGMMLTYGFPASTWSAISDGAKLNVDYTIKFRVTEQNSNTVGSLQSFTVNKKYDISNSSGSFEVDLFGLIASALSSGSVSLTDLSTYLPMMQALSGQSVDGWEITSRCGSPTSAAFKLGNLSFKFTSNVGSSETSSEVVKTYVFSTFYVSADAYGMNTNKTTQHRNHSVDLVKGENTSYAYYGDSSDSLVMDSSSVVTNTDYLTYDSSSKTYSYYNSDSNDTTYNLTIDNLALTLDYSSNVSGSGVGSSGSFGSVVQNNNVSLPDKIYLFIQSTGAGSSDDIDVTIEDDDLTDTGLRTDLSDGYGLIDDASTPEKNDGYISMIADVFSGLDDDFAGLVMFGVSTTIGIAILRMIFKR
jgi:hypothetical protein